PPPQTPPPAAPPSAPAQSLAPSPPAAPPVRTPARRLPAAAPSRPQGSLRIGSTLPQVDVRDGTLAVESVGSYRRGRQSRPHAQVLAPRLTAVCRPRCWEGPHSTARIHFRTSPRPGGFRR